MGSLWIKSAITVIGCVLLSTEIQGVNHLHSFFPPKHRLHSYALSPPHLSLLDFFLPPTHSVRGMGNPRDTFINQWQRPACGHSPIGRYGGYNCRHRDRVTNQPQPQKIMERSGQNERSNRIYQRNYDWDTPRAHPQQSTTNNQQEQASEKHRNSGSWIRNDPKFKLRENNLMRNRQDYSHQEPEPIYHKQSKITSPKLERNQRSTSPRQPPEMKEIANLDVTGYYPDEITIEVKNDGQIIIKGLHVCDCEESCFEREFQRRVALPKGTHAQSLKAVFTPESKLRILGYYSKEEGALQFESPFYVSVDSEGNLPLPEKRNSDPTCGGQKRGIKLKQIESRSRKLIEDYPDERTEKQFEAEIDEDGVTIETDE